MKVLNFLSLHIDKRYPPEKWAELLEIRIIDPDGWRGHRFDDFKQPIDLEEFVQRVNKSTIAPVHEGAKTAWLAPANLKALA